MSKKLHKISFALTLFFLLFASWFCSKNPPLEPSQTNQQGIYIFVGVQSVPDVINPGGRSIVRALVLDQNNQPVAGRDIHFSANSGTLVPTVATTDDSGFATSTFTAPQNAGTATISATHNSVTHTTTVDVSNSAEGQRVGFQTTDNTLLADGISTVMLISTWRSESGRALTGLPVEFTTTAGTILSPVYTDSAGIARTVLTSVARRTDAIAEIVARYDSVEIATSILLKGINFSIAAIPGTVIADGRSSSNIRIIIKETTSTVAISKAMVRLGTNLGTIPNLVVTDVRGVAEAELISTQETGIARVIATYGQTLSDTVSVLFGESVPTYLTLSADPTVIQADNHSTSVLQAVVTDAANNPVPNGTAVNFEIVDGSGTIESNKTTEGGIAQSFLTSSNKPDTVTIVARVDQLTDTTVVRLVVGGAAAVTVTADSSSLPADGTTSTRVSAHVFDSAGNPVVNGTMVNFTANIGDITESVQTVNGQAVAQFSSNVTGIATITATAGLFAGQINIQLRPGPPNSILLSYDPKTLGVKDSGRNQTVTVTALVIDSQNNPAIDGTMVEFSIFASPGGGEFISNTDPIPTLNGEAQISLNSGIRSGSVRIMAQVTDEAGVPIPANVRAVSTEIIIFAGPPYIENVNDAGTSHLAVGVSPLNIRGWDVVNNIAVVTAVVGDKYNNPVPAGTAVYFSISGGVIATEGFTDAEGVVSVNIHSGQPLPDITRFYSTDGVSYDPNGGHADFSLFTDVIPGPIPDFEWSEVLNSIGDMGENDGVARVVAVTEGVDTGGNPARVWSVTSVVFSGLITYFQVNTDKTELSPGETAVIDFIIYDRNGNPIVPGSEIIVSTSSGDAGLSWRSLTTSDPGVTHYAVTVTNNIDPSDPDAKESTTPVTVQVNSENGRVVGSSPPINLNLN